MTIRSNAKGRHIPWSFEWNAETEAAYLGIRDARLNAFLRRFSWVVAMLMAAFLVKDAYVLPITGDPHIALRLSLVGSCALLWASSFLPIARGRAIVIAALLIISVQSGLCWLNSRLPNGIHEGMPALMLLPIFMGAMTPQASQARWLLPLVFLPNLALAFSVRADALAMAHVLAWSGVSAAASFIVFRFGHQVFRQNYQLATELKQLAFRDPLTGLHNRRAFFSDPQVARLPRAASGSVVYSDIDFFKKINDERGHEEGDRVLGQYADLLRAFLRERPGLGEAIAARIGGEEFVLWLPETDLIRAAQLAELLRREVELLGFTASFGVAPVMASEDIDVGLRRADLALYNAKAHGRNRVETAN